MVLALSERYLGSKSEAEDVAQEVFDRLFRKAAELREPGSLRSFAYRFTMNSLQMELRRRKRGAWLTFEEPDAVAELRAFVPDVESRDLLARLATQFGRLTPHDRLCFLLKRIDAMTLEEIATELEIPLVAVKRSIRRASLKLGHWVDAEPELIALVATAVQRRVRSAPDK
jgi:RNA polymerase sigma-70 factor (ECF subfamily)